MPDITFKGTAKELIVYLLGQDPNTVFDLAIHKEKRSLSANALYWQMCTQMAKAIHITNQAMHNQLLRKYGSQMLIDNQEVWAALPDTDEAEAQVEQDKYNHLLPTSKKTGKRRWYKLLKPSHEFDTSEMSRLIDGAADEMRQMGLIPPMDEDIHKAIEQYEKRNQ